MIWGRSVNLPGRTWLCGGDPDKDPGPGAVSQLYYYSSYGRNDDYWSAQSLVSTGSVDRLPRIPLYMAVTASISWRQGRGFTCI